MENFKDLKYERPDLKQFKKEVTRLLAQFKAAAGFEEADAAFLKMQHLMEGVFTQNTIASVRNTMNMKDEFYDAEIKFFNREIPKQMMLLKKGSVVSAHSFRLGTARIERQIGQGGASDTARRFIQQFILNSKNLLNSCL